MMRKPPSNNPAIVAAWEASALLARGAGLLNLWLAKRVLHKSDVAQVVNWTEQALSLLNRAAGSGTVFETDKDSGHGVDPRFGTGRLVVKPSPAGRNKRPAKR